MKSSKTPTFSRFVAFFCALTPIWAVAQDSAEAYQTGRASFYGKYFHGRMTANGERFNQNALTAAHRTLPFGTVVRVTRTDNHKSVIVTINDRGPYVKNRVIDLSKGAAASLGMLDKGVADVVIETLSWGDNKYKNKYPIPEKKQDEFDMPVLASKVDKPTTKKGKTNQPDRAVLIPEEYSSKPIDWGMTTTSPESEVVVSPVKSVTATTTVVAAPAPKYGVSDETFYDLPGSEYLDAIYSSENDTAFVEVQDLAAYQAAKGKWATTTSYKGEAETDLPIQTAKEIVEQQSIKYVSPISYTSGTIQTAKAIPYYKEHEGQMTSSGEVYYNWDYTAAHESYPFGTMLKVSRRDNQQFVIVKVNDRLSSGSQSMVLLSGSASDALAMNGSSADVTIEPVSLDYIAKLGTQTSTVLTASTETSTNQPIAQAGPVGKTADAWSEEDELGVKIGNYENVKEAISLVEQLYGFGYDNLVVLSDMTDDGLSFSVIAGPFESEKAAKDYKNLLAQAKIEGKIIPMDKSR